MRTLLRFAMVSVVLVLIPTTSSVARDNSYDELTLTKLQLKLRGPGKSGQPRDSLVLKVSFPYLIIPVDFDPLTDGVLISIDSEEVISLPPLREPAKTRRLGTRWKYREKNR